MIDATTIEDGSMSLSSKMIRDEATSRGWKVWAYYPGSASMRLQRPDGKKLEIYSATPPTTTFVAAENSNNKYASMVLHQEVGLPVPRTWIVKTNEEARKIAGDFFKQSQLLVVKPLDSAHGNGVTVGVNSIEKLDIAFTLACQFADFVILQEQILNPVDIRLTCIDYKFMAGLIRVPARVTGDGVHSIEKLIAKENEDPRRGPRYTRALNYIDLEGAKRYLGEKLQSIPATGEIVQVVGTANHGTGGELIDITDDLPSWLVEDTEKAARVSELPVCGVDFLLKKPPVRTASREDLDPKIIEINKCPAIFMHEPPAIQKSRGVIKAYLDYLGAV